MVPNENDVLAFDWGTTIIGILDVERNVYMPNRFAEGMLDGAKRIATSVGTIVSFNGNGCDLIEIAKIVSISSKEALSLRCQHDDMAEIISAIRWPPDPGTTPIRGQNLLDTYRHYFINQKPRPPAHIDDVYELDNWADCYMTTELWKKWKRGEIGRCGVLIGIFRGFEKNSRPVVRCSHLHASAPAIPR